MHRTYTFKAEIWKHQGKTPWHFVTLPVEMAAEIKFFFSHVAHAWKSIYVTVTLNKSTWKTSIFPDNKLNSYFLPIKSQIRQKEHVEEGDEIEVTLDVED